MDWFTSDFHLSHKNIITYCDRPFANVEEMDKVILENLSNKVKDEDRLFYLGDLTFKSEVAEKFFHQFRRLEIHYIIGNHENATLLEIAKKHCASVSHILDIIINDVPITLCHYAMRVWNKSHLNAWQLYGHSHSRLEPIGKQYDVGVDNNAFKPLSFTDLLEIMEKAPNNYNYIPPELRSAKKI
jgi:calcineurin-like phosphoesterase family protein